MDIQEARRVKPKNEASRLLRTQAPNLEPTHRGPITLVDEEGAPIIIVAPFDGDLKALRKTFLAYKCDSTTSRAGGISNKSRTFGYMARSVANRRSACSTCSGASKYPNAHQELLDTAAVLATQLKELAPEIAKHQEQELEQVLPEWRMPGGFWTSGVLNETSELGYHFDRNNLDAWSAMPVLRRHTRGGHLHLPELNVVLELKDGDVVFFNGGDWIHGVTPISMLRDNAYRFSCVYYPVKAMSNCLTWKEEVKFGRNDRTEREETMLERQREQGLLR